MKLSASRQTSCANTKTGVDHHCATGLHDELLQSKCLENVTNLALSSWITSIPGLHPELEAEAFIT